MMFHSLLKHHPIKSIFYKYHQKFNLCSISKINQEIDYDVIDTDIQAKKWLDDIFNKLNIDINKTPPYQNYTLDSEKFQDKIWFAVDTEYEKITRKSNVHNTRFALFSVFGGPTCLNSKNSIMSKPAIFITRNNETTNISLLQTIKPFFESPYIEKIFHFYGRDYHVLLDGYKKYGNFEFRGFVGDTYHMSRIYNANVDSDSLLHLSQLYNPNGIIKSDKLTHYFHPSETLEHRYSPKFQEYAAKDALATYQLSIILKEKLNNEYCKMEWFNQDNNIDIQLPSIWQLYKEFWRPFGQLLVEMEQNGIKVDRELLYKKKLQGKNEIDDKMKLFINWADKQVKNGKYINPGSKMQLGYFFFGDNNSQMSIEVPTKNLSNDDQKLVQPNKNGKMPNKIILELGTLGMDKIGETATGRPSMTKEVLQKLIDKRLGMHFNKNKQETESAINAVKSLIDGLAINKQISTYIIPFLEEFCDDNDRIHSQFNLNTETGRLSSTTPNLQNVPSVNDTYEIRKSFIPEKNNIFIIADYAQLELRVLAFLSNCQSMINAFDIGGDFHSKTALSMYDHIKKAVNNGYCYIDEYHRGNNKNGKLIKDIFPIERHRAKTLNFSLAYGKTEHGLSIDLDVSKSDARGIIERWYMDRKEVRKWQIKQKKIALKTGSIYSLIGRRRQLFNIYDIFENNDIHKEFLKRIDYMSENENDIDIGIIWKKFEKEYFLNKNNIDINSIMRQAINTPVQSGAADIVMKGMLNIWENDELRDLGFKILIQIHDELILEGPICNVEIAKNIVKKCMENPWQGMSSKVRWETDIKHANNWSK